MVRFRVFGRASIVVAKVFGCLRSPDGAEVRVFSDCAAAMDLDGEEARQFVRFVDLRTDPDDGGPTMYAGRAAPPPPGEAEEAMRSAP